MIVSSANNTFGLMTTDAAGEVGTERDVAGIEDAVGISVTVKLLTVAGAATAGIAIPVTVASLMAIKGAQGAFSASIVNRADGYRHFGERREADNARIAQESSVTEFDGDHTSFIGRVYGIMHNVRSDRAETSHIANRKNLVKTVAISAGAAALGELAAVYALPRAEHLIHDWFSHGHSQTPAQTPSNSPKPKLPASQQPGGPDYGFQPNIPVTHGAGYDQMVTKLVAERGIHLDGAQSWLLYTHLQSTFGEHIFSNNTGYLMGPNANDLGIGNAGVSYWSPGVLREVNTWLAQHNLTDPVSPARQS